jgi:hypothetical protein
MTRRFASHQVGSRGRLAVRLLVFAGALVGLFAMHGLSDHGASAHEMPSTPMSPAVVAMSHHSDDTSDAGQTSMEAAGTFDGVPADHSPGMAMAGLCLAVLAGAVIWFLLLRANRTLVFAGPRHLDFMPAPLAARRDRDPPCLFELSVQRT